MNAATSSAGNFTSERLAIPDVVLVRSRKFRDARGYFVETYVEPAFRALGVACRFVQDNHSMSASRGTIRGLHFQTPPHAQAKLVRVLRGSIFDVAVDLRRNSPTYGRWCAATLSADGGEALFIPAGFAHGFCTLEPDAEVAYKVDNVYAPECDGGLKWDDPALAIAWPLPHADILVSEKDGRLPSFMNFASPF